MTEREAPGRTPTLVAVNDRIWFNNRLPQTLVVAQFLLYADLVVFLLLDRGSGPLALAFGSVAALIINIAKAAGAHGIANGERWGYWLAIAATGLTLVSWLLVVLDSGTDVSLIGAALSMVFDIAVFVALIHPMSRQHQKVWFH
jgi:hypothetical protein